MNMTAVSKMRGVKHGYKDGGIGQGAAPGWSDAATVERKEEDQAPVTPMRAGEVS
jgi:hypothetical protein